MKEKEQERINSLLNKLRVEVSKVVTRDKISDDLKDQILDELFKVDVTVVELFVELRIRK